MFSTAASHGRGLDQLHPGTVRFLLCIAWRDAVFLTQFFPNLIQARRKSAWQSGALFVYGLRHFCFWSNAEHAESFRILETQVFREDGRAEYNRFRETGTETTSGI
jgi:NDP-sugar pyrophosphorylase family protein